MTAITLDGKAAAADIKNEMKERVARLHAAGITPGLGTIMVGEDPGSKIYVNGKHRDSAEIGIKSMRLELPMDATAEDVTTAIEYLNRSQSCTGFIVQLPLPAHIEPFKVLEKIDPEKDADGLNPLNIGQLALSGNADITVPIPCTPRGIVELGRRGGFDWSGANVCVVGQGPTAGRPLSILLTHPSINSTVDSCHIGTRDLANHTLRADAIVAAAGVAHLITPDMVKPGAAVFDVGVTRINDPQTGKSRIVGDVDPAVAEVAGWMSPNPGGVGPMTRAMLMVNVVEAAERHAGMR